MGTTWRLVAVGAALAPTVLTIVTAPHAGSYAGFVDRPIDPAEIDRYYLWQSLVALPVPAGVVVVAWLCRGRAHRPAAAVAAILLALLAVVAVVEAIARDAFPPTLPAVPPAVPWMYAPCFAVAAAALMLARRRPPAAETTTVRTA